MKSIWLFLVAIGLNQVNTADVDGQWASVSGPWGSFVDAFAACPDGKGGTDLFAGSFGGGVFLSTDMGISWTQVDNGLAPTSTGEEVARNTVVRALVVVGTKIFAGTGGGIFVSSDYGSSWNSVDSGLTNTWVNSLAVSPNKSSGTNIYAGTDNGVFLSTNEGANWTPVDTSSADPTVDALAASGTNVFAGTMSGVYVSTDNGSSWALKDSGMSAISHVYALDVSPSSDGINSASIYAATYDGLYLSTNDGFTWTHIDSALASTFVTALAVSGTEIFAGMYNAGISLSTDNGKSWTFRGLEDAAVSKLAVYPDGKGGELLFAGGGYGVYRSTDKGLTWRSSGITAQSIRCFAFMGSNILAGTSKGIYVSADGGTSWGDSDGGLADYSIDALAVSGTNIFAGTATDGVFLSTDNGTTWKAVNNGLTDSLVISFAVSGPNIFAGTSYFGGVFCKCSLDSVPVAGYGVYLSTNGGGKWAPVDSGLPTTSINVLFSNGANLFAGTDNGVYLSTNGGGLWAPLNNGLSDQHVKCFAFDGSNLYAGTSTGVDLSTNNGNTWRLVGSGMLDINTIVASGKNLLAGTFGGVFQSTDYGTTWRAANDGMMEYMVDYAEVPWVNALAVIPDSVWTGSSNVLAGTDISGVWRRPLSEMIDGVKDAKGEIPSVSFLRQNYPNPFNPSTTITYELSAVSHVTLKVYDVLGKEVKTLVNERETAGSYSITFDASKLPSGVYFYRLQAGSYSKTMKLLLLK